MRISAEEYDIGYENYLNIENKSAIKIYLNGDVLEKGTVITADEETGMIVRYVKDDDGYFILNRENDCVVTEVLYGDVKIVREEKSND